MIRHYCSNCCATKRFIDCGDYRVCIRCCKRLHVVPKCARPLYRKIKLARMLSRYHRSWVPTRTI